MTTDATISSDGAFDNRVRAIAENLRALQDLLDGLRAMRSRLLPVEQQTKSTLVNVRAELVELLHRHSELASSIDAQRNEMASLVVLRAELETALADTAARFERLTAKFEQQQRDVEARLDSGLQSLQVGLDVGIQQQIAANEEWQRIFADRQARQVDDVLRAYDLISARQNEVERAAISRFDALDHKILEQEQANDSALAALDRRTTERQDSIRTEAALISRRITFTFSAALGLVTLLLLFLIVLLSR